MIRDIAQVGLRDRVITPGATNVVIPSGSTDAKVTVSAVTFNPAKVLNDTTIAGTLGTMPENGALNFTPSASAQTGPAGHTTGVGVAAVTFNAAKLLNDTVIAGITGTMPHNTGAVTGALYPASGHLDIVPPQGYMDGTAGDYIHVVDPNFIPSNILNTASIFGLAGTAIPLKIIAGDTVVLSSAVVSNALTTSLIKFAEIRVNISGNIRAKETIYGDAASTVYGQIFVNGVAVSALHSYGTYSSSVTFSDDISVNAGDLVQAYAKCSAGTSGHYVSLTLGIALQTSDYGATIM